jgi:peptidoglycan/LPS O-acetylase OafA/YrhL
MPSEEVPATRDVKRRPRLPALTGVRILAALRIYLFHIKQANDAGIAPGHP